MDLDSAGTVVLQALAQAPSQNTAELKPAEEQLRQWETQPGFYSVLLVRYSSAHLLYSSAQMINSSPNRLTPSPVLLLHLQPNLSYSSSHSPTCPIAPPTLSPIT